MDEVSLGDLIPFAEDIEQVTRMFKAAHHSAIEAKAGRVLSGQNERRIREATETLVSVLAAAGVRITVEETPEDEDVPDSLSKPGKDDVRKPVDPAVDVTTTSPTASAKSAVPGIEVKDGAFVLDVEAMRRQAAEYAALAADN